MTFTALHRALGRAPGPLTNDMIDEAVSIGLAESADLDWKSKLPPTAKLHDTDYPKDIAAMANSGGGTIVYGVDEKQKAASARVDVGTLTEAHERTLRSVAGRAIMPAVLGLEIYSLDDGGSPPHAVVVVVPASIDGPHFIYKGDYFAAPFRNDADTAWMTERQVEAMYRARFNERRRAMQAIDDLYRDMAAGRDSVGPYGRAWFIAVAHPRLPAVVGPRPSRDTAREAVERAASFAHTYSGDTRGYRPLDSVDRDVPRPGLRRWIAPFKFKGDGYRGQETWAAIHNDGSVGLAAAVGGWSRPDTSKTNGAHLESQAIEVGVSALFGLIRAASEHWVTSEYDAQIGIDWSHNSGRLVISTIDGHGVRFEGTSTPLAHYTPVTTTVVADAAPDDFHGQLRDTATDCINQGGISNLTLIYDAPAP